VHDEQLYQRWTGWLEVIAGDVFRLRHSQRMWSELVDIVKANQDIPEPWHVMGWIKNMYGAYLAVGIRAQADTQSNVICLARLLRGVHSRPKIVTRARYTSSYPAEDVEIANLDFDSLAGKNRQYVDPAIVKNDLDRLSSISRQTREVVTKHIVHRGEEPAAADVTFDQLHETLEAVGKLFQKYHQLLTGARYTTTVPVLPYDWKQAFTVAWLPRPVHRWQEPKGSREKGIS
jgi:hypothetical protein